MSLVTYFLDKTKEFRKSIVLFKQVGNVCSPVMYISKPKHVSQEEFDELFNKIQITVKK